MEDKSVARRREAGEFLRSRRARLSPRDVDLPQGSRRRTPGLRREEVATLANVGTTWYTWLEQGRDVRPSSEVLSTIAEALHCNPIERRHLFLLFDRTAPEQTATPSERVGEPLRRMLDSMTGQPAYVLGRRWDVLAWNRAAEVVYGPYARLQGDQRNAMYLVFVDPDHRRLLVDWEALAKSSLAMFRADSARYVGDPEFQRLIELLQRDSPEFQRWWPQREVLLPLTGQKRINHPVVGRMVFEFSSFSVNGSPDMKLVVFTPLEENTASRLAVCLS